VEYSDLDKRDGFIHLSTVVQVPRTVTRFFAHDAFVQLLKIRYADVEHTIKWEIGGKSADENNLFPHVYGELPMTAVVKVIRVGRREDGEFAFDGQWWE
jgi:uncharacterized protein (DUF952 family)